MHTPEPTPDLAKQPDRSARLVRHVEVLAARAPRVGLGSNGGMARRHGNQQRTVSRLCPLLMTAFFDGFQQQWAGKDIADVRGK